MASSDDEARWKLLTAAADLYASVSRAFRQEPDSPRTVGNERERHAAALVRVAQFFCALGDRRLGDRFFELSSAIAELSQGTLHPLLRQARPQSRPADPSQLWRARARVALALEALIRTGLSPSEAAAEVARKVPKIGNLAGAKARMSKLPTTMLGWRKQISAGRVKNFQAQELLQEGLERMRGLTRAELREFAKRQGDELGELPGELTAAHNTR